MHRAQSSENSLTRPARILVTGLSCAVLSCTAAAWAQSGQAPGPVAGTGIAPHASAPAAHIGGAPTGSMRGPARAPGAQAPGIQNSGTANHFGSRSYGSGLSPSPNSSFAQGDYIAPPRPSFELPRDPRPTFEVPRHSGVEPYRTNPHSGSVGYGAFPYGYVAPGFYPPYIDSGYADNGYMDPNGGDAAQAGDAGAGPSGMYPNGSEARPPYPMRNDSGAGYGAISRPYTQPATAANETITNGLDHPEITLVFKDGRPPEQIKNYAVTRTTLFVLDGTKRRQIPLSALDLDKTIEKNQAAGADFTVPGQPASK